MTSLRVFSTYVITDPCIGVKDGTCVEVCPVDCIETTDADNQFFIAPDLCIACEQCVLVCPVDAIYLEHEVPAEWEPSIQRNADFFVRAEESAPAVPAAEAQEMISRARQRAGELGIAVSVAIVDKRGELVATGEVGSPPTGSDVKARDLAYSAGAMELATRSLDQKAVDAAPESVDRSRIVLEGGGIPIGRPWVTGGIGVSGGTPGQDHECSRAAVTSAH